MVSVFRLPFFIIYYIMSKSCLIFSKKNLKAVKNGVNVYQINSEVEIVQAQQNCNSLC